MYLHKKQKNVADECGHVQIVVKLISRQKPYKAIVGNVTRTMSVYDATVTEVCAIIEEALNADVVEEEVSSDAAS